MNHRDEIILKKVLSEVNVAADMMKGCSLADFLDNEMLKRAVCMTVINVGELVKNLTEDCRLSHPEVAWKNIAGFRDIAAHKYQTLRMEDVYETTVTFRICSERSQKFWLNNLQLLSRCKLLCKIFNATYLLNIGATVTKALR